MKTKLRSNEELAKMVSYLKDSCNTKDNQFVSLVLPSYPIIVPLNELLKRYFKERMWLRKNDNNYREFKGDKFSQYFIL